MKRRWFLNVWVVLAYTVGLSGAVQKHSPVNPEAPETNVQKLHDDLTQGKKLLVIDVRSAKEYAEGHVPGAINIPIEGLSEKIAEKDIAKDMTIVTACEHGGRGSRAVAEFRKLRYTATSFCRLAAWRKGGYKIEIGIPQPRPATRVYRFRCQHSCVSYVETTDLGQICERCDCGRPYHECMKEN